MPKFGEVCEHGSLKRQCPICERDAEVSRLKEEVEMLRAEMGYHEAKDVIEQLTAQREQLAKELSDAKAAGEKRDWKLKAIMEIAEEVDLRHTAGFLAQAILKVICSESWESLRAKKGEL